MHSLSLDGEGWWRVGEWVTEEKASEYQKRECTEGGSLVGATNRSRYQLGRRRDLSMISPPQGNLHIIEDHSSYRQLERNVETEIFLHILGKQMIKCLHLHVKILKKKMSALSENH